MSDIVTVAIITSLGPIITLVVAAFVKKWFNTAKEDVAAVSDKLDEVHKQINGHMTELIELTKKSSKAEGKLEAKEEAENDKK